MGYEDVPHCTPSPMAQSMYISIILSMENVLLSAGDSLVAEKHFGVKNYTTTIQVLINTPYCYVSKTLSNRRPEARS